MNRSIAHRYGDGERYLKANSKKKMLQALSDGSRALLLFVTCCALTSCQTGPEFRTSYDARQEGVYIPPSGPASTNSRFLVAQGDSWFSYAMPSSLNMTTGDVVDDLMDPGIANPDKFYVLSVATAGKTLLQMNSESELSRVEFAFNELSKQKLTLEAFLLSGGGNDAHPIFENFFRPFNPEWLDRNDEYVLSHFDTFADESKVDEFVAELTSQFVELANSIFALEQKYFGKTSPLLMHGYDYPIPDGSAPRHALGQILEPWLQPQFNKKGYALVHIRDSSNRTKDSLKRLHLATMLTHVFIDKYNESIKRAIGQKNSFAGTVVFVDLRNSLIGAKDQPFSMMPNRDWELHSPYLRLWQNEMHPSDRGFASITRKYISILDDLAQKPQTVATSSPH